MSQTSQLPSRESNTKPSPISSAVFQEILGLQANDDDDDDDNGDNNDVSLTLC